MVWRRRRSIVNWKQQTMFALEVVAVVGGFTMLCLFLMFIPPMSDWLGSDPPGVFQIDDVGRLAAAKWPAIVVSLGLLFVIGLLMAHRLAGPMKGLELTLAGWRSGNRKARVRFRANDYIQPLMAPLNAFLEDRACMEDHAIDLARSALASMVTEDLKKKAETLLSLSGRGSERLFDQREVEPDQGAGKEQ